MSKALAISTKHVKVIFLLFIPSKISFVKCDIVFIVD